MIWPFTELQALRTRELDYNRQIASLSTRLELLTQENSRLHSTTTQYIDDLRRIARLTDSTDSSQSTEPDGELLSTTSRRAQVQAEVEEFRKRPPNMDMLDHVRGFYQRAAELNNLPTDSQEASEESSTAN